MAELHVALVSVEREIWSGEATEVNTRTTEGELGILPGHTPLLGQVAAGATVRITREGDDEIVAAVHGGFLSVTNEGVTILAEIAELSDDIDTARARTALEKARSEKDEDAERRAEARLAAAGEKP